MSDPLTGYASRLENKLENIQAELRYLSESMVEMKAINSHQRIQSDNAQSTLEELKEKVSKAEGGLFILKVVAGFLLSIFISGFGWIVSDRLASTQKINDMRTQVSVNTEKLLRIERDVSSLRTPVNVSIKEQE